jgi:hypothetical protein
MPSPAGQLDRGDVRTSTASAVTIGGTSISLTLIGGSLSTLFVEWLAPVWPSAIKPEVSSAINTLCIALVIGLALGGGWLADVLRKRVTDTRPPLESNQPSEKP